MGKLTRSAVLAAVMLLCGCGGADETYRPEGYVTPADSAPPTTALAAPSEAVAATPSESALSDSRSAESSGANHDIAAAPYADNDTLRFTLENVFSGGEYYTVSVSGTRSNDSGGDTVSINGEAYDIPELTLSKDGEQLGSLQLTADSGEHFVLLENIAKNSSYGYEIISNMREFGAAEYPDILGLVFRGGNETAVPEYARYFAVFDGTLAELPIYENEQPVDPRGAKLEPASAGAAKQYLTVLNSSGSGYHVIKYEYRFDLDNRRLNRQQVRFTGWNH
ncbi:MAG: hypothetical protein K2J80_02620 [Oscillospiraceae bacterium]|nr:hypothetical protein [Oscillospiraceae bacterium]